jgi:hypothetical protein
LQPRNGGPVTSLALRQVQRVPIQFGCEVSTQPHLRLDRRISGALEAAAVVTDHLVRSTQDGRDVLRDRGHLTDRSQGGILKIKEPQFATGDVNLWIPPRDRHVKDDG